MTDSHTRWEAKRYVTPVMIISLVYNLPRFFELNVVEIVDGMNQTITTFIFCLYFRYV